MGAIAIGRTLAVLAVAIACVAACGHAAAPTSGPEQLNGISASQAVDAITKAGLQAPNRRDVTAQKCQELNCVQAVDTDTVSVIKFPTTGIAQKYEASARNVYVVEDLVLSFPEGLPLDRQRQYEDVVAKLAA